MIEAWGELVKVAAEILQKRSFQDGDPDDEVFRMWAIRIREAADHMKAARPAPNHTKDSTGGPSACKWCAHKDMTCLIPHISCDHPLFGPGALTPNVPTEPGRYRMTMEMDVEMFPGTDACFIVWHGAEPIGSVGSINNEKYDITAHFERIEEES
jgi:hypothetical protein